MGENRPFSCYVARVNNGDFFLFQTKKLAISPTEVFFGEGYPGKVRIFLLNMHKNAPCMIFPVPEILKEKKEGLLCREKWNCAV